jgi:hypothetical protein
MNQGLVLAAIGLGVGAWWLFRKKTGINTSLFGTVFDTTGQPLSGVRVTIGTYAISTDIDGYYSFGELPVSPEGDVVRITYVKTGYISITNDIVLDFNTVNEVHSVYMMSVI